MIGSSASHPAFIASKTELLVVLDVDRLLDFKPTEMAA